MPFPIASAGRMMKVSPVPAQTWPGCDGETASALIEAASWSSKTGAQVTPRSLDFQMPPEAAPK